MSSADTKASGSPWALHFCGPSFQGHNRAGPELSPRRVEERLALFRHHLAIYRKTAIRL